ncbi:carboxypeptidase D, b isoform X2 [Hoplias malabaricus]|uniref:carboxypeptidase D, b isoform X2 n=1 Tax=Hoplias malabaricus TaxID=27720 RepID=UPI003462B104
MDVTLSDVAVENGGKLDALCRSTKIADRNQRAKKMANFWSLLTQLFAILYIVYFVNCTFESNNEETYLKYYNHAELTRRLWRFSEKFPHICRVSSAGKSVEGRELWVVRVTTDPDREEPGKPRFKYLGNVHGNEAVSRQVLVYLTEFLLTRYGVEPRVTELLNRTDIYIMPTMNPDGFERATEGQCEGNKGRENAKRVDLNSKFPDNSDLSDPSRVLESEAPEVTAVSKWILQKKFVLSGNLLGGSIVASYPFDHSSSHTTSGMYSQTPDDALFCYLAQTYAEKQPVMKEGRPSCSDDPKEVFKDNINNGAELYSIQGVRMQDFNYFQGNCFEVSFGLGYCKYPLASELYTEWTNNREALLTYIEKVHIGIKGYVMNSAGMGLPDSYISVAGIDHNITTLSFGDYYRLLLPGTYNITASFPGYILKTVNNVKVTEGKATILNFTLKDSSEEMLVSEPLTSTVPTTSYSTIRSLHSEGASTHEPSIQPPDFRHYSYLDMELFLKQISAVYSSITHLYSIGQSVQARELYVMEISLNTGSDQPGKPAIVFVGNLQGNDVFGREMLLNLVGYLCSNYGSNTLVTRLVNSTRIHILPSVNPDGYEMALEGMIGIKYPVSVDSPDESVFKSIADTCFVGYPSLQMSKACKGSRPLHRNHYYSAPAGTDMHTWAYKNTDALGFNIGLSCDLYPQAKIKNASLKQNLWVLLQFIQQVHFSVRGKLTDVLSGQAIANAAIVAEGSRHQVHTSNSGQYWRPLSPGKYKLQASAPGYTTVTVTVRVVETHIEQVDIRLTPEQLSPSQDKLEEKEFQKILEDLSSAHNLKQLVQRLLPAETLHYRNYRERSEFLQELALSFPHITRLYSLGHSWEFRTIWALEITGSPESPRSTDPKIRYMAGLHGNAAAGPELLLEFAVVLCINYGGNPTITKLIDRSRIVIVPCVNPDGRELAQEGMCFSTAGLTNAHGVDLDTDFLYGNLSVQPETHAVMDLMQREGFLLSINLEGGSLLVTYPYDRTVKPAQNEETLKYLAAVYTNNHPRMHFGYPGCQNGPESVPGGILRGAEFSLHSGSMKDFSMDVSLCPEITVYTACCLYPSTQQLLLLWAEHRVSLFAMLLEIQKGLSGVVRDNAGQPVSNAVISVNGSVFIHTDTKGYFHALLPPGSHQLQVYAQGFPQQIKQVNLSSHQMASPVVIEFTENGTKFSPGVVLFASISIIAILVMSLLIWHFHSAKFSRIRDSVERLCRHRDNIPMEDIVSETSPLRGMFLEDSESEDDAFYLEHH